ncbi:MAG: Gldg family protein [Victivallales bacterium]|nr:Gldg family protein [Victivallales bacterium]
MKLTKAILLSLLAIIAINALFHFWRPRLDTTAEKRFTLTAETRRILEGLTRPVTIDLYLSKSVSGMPPSLQSYCDYVNELLDEYQQHANGKLLIQRHDPIPGSSAEEQAMRSGMLFEELRKDDASSRFCMGICFRRLGHHDISLRQLNPSAQNGLEYDITRALMQISDDKPVTIGVMSRLPVFGGIDAEQKHHLQEWTALTALRDCNYELLPMPDQTTAVPENIDVLLMIHPMTLNSQTQKALDDFIQRGGRLMAFIDPGCWTDMMLTSGQKAQGCISTSNLGELPKAWGITYSENKLVLDRSLATIVLNRQSVPENHIEWLSLTENCISRKQDLTAYLSHVEVFLAGSVTWQDIADVRATPLLTTGTTAQLVESQQAFRHQSQLEKDYSSDNVEYCLALSLEGKLPSAYDSTHTSKPTRVIIFCDADCLHDNFTKNRKTDNLQLFLNFMDSLRMSDDGLMNLRNRSFVNRSLTRLEEQQQLLRTEYQKMLDSYQQERDTLAEEVRKLEASSNNGTFSDTEGEKLRNMYDRLMAADTELRGLQVKANKSMESVRQRIILWNLLLGPGLLMLILFALMYITLLRSNWQSACRLAVYAVAIIAVIYFAIKFTRLGKNDLDNVNTAVRGDLRLLSTPLNRDAITEIKLTSRENAVIIVRNDDGWTLPDKAGFPADNRMLSQLLESVGVCTGELLKISPEDLSAVSLDGETVCKVIFHYADGTSVSLGFGNWKRNYLNEYQGRYLLNDLGQPMLTGYQFPEVGQPTAAWLAKTLPGFGSLTKRIVRVSEFKELGWCLDRRPGGYEIQGKIPRGYAPNASVIKNIIDNFLFLKVLDVTDKADDFRPEFNLQVIGDDDIQYDYTFGSSAQGYVAKLTNARSVQHADKAQNLLGIYGKYYMEVNEKLAKAFLRNRKELFMISQ